MSSSSLSSSSSETKRCTGHYSKEGGSTKCTNPAVWMDKKLLDYKCDSCLLKFEVVTQMEFDWCGPSDAKPKREFSCAPGGGVMKYRHAENCTCGPEMKQIVDDLEVGFQALNQFRSWVGSNRFRAVALFPGLKWDDIDIPMTKLWTMQDAIVGGMANAHSKKRKHREEDHDATDKKEAKVVQPDVVK